MAKQSIPQRTIRGAIFDHGIGVISVYELMELSASDWGGLRDRITDGKNGSPDGLSAKCLMCGGDVYIRSRKLKNSYLPYFAHYKSECSTSCPWYSGDSHALDAMRAKQYHGRQESFIHRYLCNEIERLAKSDSRYIESFVDTYLPPTEGGHGRYPDVYFEWSGFPPIVVEVQLSRTFQTEISGRCTYYQRENALLLWVFYDVDPRTGALTQDVVDIVRRHRGNMFALDHEAFTLSHKNETLVVKCYLQKSDESFDDPVYVRFDELDFSGPGLPFFEDRITPELVKDCNLLRPIWMKAVKRLTFEDCEKKILDSWPVTKAFDDAFARVPNLKFVLATSEDRFVFLRLIGAIFSILATANNKNKNYVTKHPNIKGMLNTLLHNKYHGLQSYATLLEEIIQGTRQSDLLDLTVGKHIARAKQDTDTMQCGETDPRWILTKMLVPEILDSFKREQLRYLGRLPAWVKS